MALDRAYPLLDVMLMNTPDKQGERHTSSSVSRIRSHVVWTPRCRRKVCVSPIAQRLDQPLRQKAAELDLDILEFTIQPDHIHLFMVADPDVASRLLAGRLNGDTSRMLRSEFPELQKLPSLWTTASFNSRQRFK